MLDINNPPQCVPAAVDGICDGASYSLSCPVGFILVGENGGVVPGGVLGGQCTSIFTDQVTVIDLPDVSCARDAGMMGEPHIKKWNGEW